MQALRCHQSARCSTRAKGACGRRQGAQERRSKVCEGASNHAQKHRVNRAGGLAVAVWHGLVGQVAWGARPHAQSTVPPAAPLTVVPQVQVLGLDRQPPESRPFASAIRERQAKSPVPFADAIKDLIGFDASLMEEEASVVGQDEEGQQRVAETSKESGFPCIL